MSDKFLAVLLVALLPSLSFAQGSQNYQCTHGDLQRRVETLYETGMTLPCEVHYYKDSEAPGEVQVLWRAMNEAGYCERKAQEFIAQLEEWGWNCGQNDTAETPADPETPAAPETPADTSPADDSELVGDPEQSEETAAGEE